MNNTLYGIDEGIRDLLKQAAENCDEMTPEQTDEWLAQFEENKLQRKVKIDNLVRYIRSEELWQAGIKSEIEILNEKIKSSQKKSESLLKYLEISMKNAEEKELTTELFKIKFQKNPASMKIDKEVLQEMLESLGVTSSEERLAIAKTKLSDRKKEMKQQLKDGQNVEGAWLEQGERLVIK